MPNIAVAIINASSVLNDDEIAAAVPALQRQVSEHFAPVWGIDATLYVVPRGAPPPAGIWWLVVLDNSDKAGELGYHDITNDGMPIGKVFAETDIRGGFSWTVTASHELLEMLADPDISRNVLVEGAGNTGTLYALEVCDPCEADQHGYTIDGVLVSDFVFPSWFESFWAPGSTQFDATQQINQPFALAPEGYILTYDIGSGSGWKQQNAAVMTRGWVARARVGSRRERRRVGRGHWLRSTVCGQ